MDIEIPNPESSMEKSTGPHDYYSAMNREELIRHCLAYSAALHDLSSRIMVLQWKATLEPSAPL